jgi:hypothetical protein
MGLIKTAMVLGGGYYALNKLTKQQQSQHTYLQGPPPQGYRRNGPDDYDQFAPQDRQFFSPPQDQNAAKTQSEVPAIPTRDSAHYYSPPPTSAPAQTAREIANTADYPDEKKGGMEL